MCAHVLLNLLNKSRKRDKILGLPRFATSNNTGAQILDSIYHMALKLIKNLCDF